MKYKVCAYYTKVCSAIVEAKNEEDAKKIATELICDQLGHVLGFGVYAVDKIKDEKEK